MLRTNPLFASPTRTIEELRKERIEKFETRLATLEDAELKAWREFDTWPRDTMHVRDLTSSQEYHTSTLEERLNIMLKKESCAQYKDITAEEFKEISRVYDNLTVQAKACFEKINYNHGPAQPLINQITNTIEMYMQIKGIEFSKFYSKRTYDSYKNKMFYIVGSFDLGGGYLLRDNELLAAIKKILESVVDNNKTKIIEFYQEGRYVYDSDSDSENDKAGWVAITSKDLETSLRAFISYVDTYKELSKKLSDIRLRYEMSNYWQLATKVSDLKAEIKEVASLLAAEQDRPSHDAWRKDTSTTTYQP